MRKSLIIFLTAMLVFVGCHKKQEKKNVQPPTPQKKVQAPVRNPSAPIKTVSVRGQYFLGSPDAPVTIVEFTDFQCPFCRRFHHQTFPIIKKDYIDTGKVKWITFNYPLSFHQFAFPAARGFVCAGQLGGKEAYWKYYMKIFSVPNLNPATPAEIAQEVGIDRTKFGECLDSEEVRNIIADSIRTANSIGISGTPTFIIGKESNGSVTGEMVVGAQPYEIFKSKIDALLK